MAAGDTGHDPGVLAAGIALGLRAIGVGRELQPVGRLPDAVPAELRGVDDAVFGDGGKLRHQFGDGHARHPVIADADVAPAVRAGIFIEDRILDIVGLVIADGRGIEPREQAVDAHAETDPRPSIATRR